uniref:Uncharacterized protein n=1 Tax=Sphaerodactylus townsendi TaxID=933632 RepID=A0ACB8FYE2_9SAUR
MSEDRSQDSTAVVLSDSNSTQDLFTEPASSQDSAKKPFPETRPYSSCLETAAPGKEILGPAEGKTEEPLENPEFCQAAEQKLDLQSPSGISSKASASSLSQWDSKRQSDPCADQFPQSLPVDLEEQRQFLTEQCITSFHLCLSRFPQHYKSLYRLAYLYAYSKTHKNLQWARDVLLGSSIPWQQLKHMPAQGLFYERNKTNFFNWMELPVVDLVINCQTAWAWAETCLQIQPSVAAGGGYPEYVLSKERNLLWHRRPVYYAESSQCRCLPGLRNAVCSETDVLSSLSAAFFAVGLRGSPSPPVVGSERQSHRNWREGLLRRQRCGAEARSLGFDVAKQK